MCYKWFAWYPVRTETDKLVWMQYVWCHPYTITGTKAVYTDGPEYEYTDTHYRYLKLTDSWLV